MNDDDALYRDEDFNEDHFEPEGEPLPVVFHSFYEERPFRCCTSCGESLEDLEETYQITKTYHGNEVILEYAMCFPCQQNMLKELSRESVEKLTSFQMERSLEPKNDVESDRFQCEFCLRSRDDAVEKAQHFSMAALCFGLQMVDRPLLICEDCMLEINEKMSEQTRRRWRDFVDHHFPGVPADSLPDPSTIPVI